MNSSDNTPNKPRIVAYAQKGIPAEDNSAHMVAFVTEDEAGYSPSTYTDDLDYCKKVAESINSSRGYSRAQVLEIVSSSLRAQQKMEDFLNGSGELP